MNFNTIKYCILLTIIVAFSSVFHAQSLSFSATPGTITCPTNPVIFSGFFSTTEVVTSYDFNGGNLPNGWSSSPFTIGQPCDAVPGNTPDNSNYFWATTLSGDVRFVQTNTINNNYGGSINFLFRYGHDDPLVGCEEADLPGEEVDLQYSTDGGGTWTTWITIPLDTYTWTTFNLTMPADAQSMSTIIRFYQGSSSGDDFDNWGIDDLSVSVVLPLTVADWSWDFGDGTTASGQNVSHTFPTVATNTSYNVSLTVTVSSGATYTSTQAYAVPAFNVIEKTTDVTCNGMADGSITIGVTGGVAPFSYQWSNGAATSSIQSLSVGTYTLTVTDALGCTSKTSAVVSDVEPINVIEKTTDATCNGTADGTITIGVTGGVAPFIYKWSNGATSSDLNGLAAGTYTVTLTDNNQCSLVASANLVEPTPMSIGTTQYSISCLGNSDGFIASTVMGGVGPYIYYWSDKSITANIDSLPAGIYELTITDAQGCTATTSASISAPPVLSLAATEVAITCYNAGNGAASATASGGTGPYNYLWSNGESGTSITNLSPGIYILTATDSKGCTALVASNITEPAILSSTINTSDATCFGANDGTLTAVSTGGTLPFAYQWSNGASNPSLNNLSTGTYMLTLTDGNGCSGVFSSSISEPTLLSVISDALDINCNGNSNGTISTTGNGGTLPYNYQWSNGASTSTIDGLSPQVYTLTITDGNGCVATSSATITEPMPLSGLATETDVSCNGGNNGIISATCSGGTLPYNYLWSNGSTGALTSGLIAGTYKLTVTDQQGCSTAITSIISEPPPLSIGTSTSNVICQGAANGSLTATISGGTLPYNYQWSNGDINPTASSLPAGSYTLTVTDANGCEVTTSTNVTEPPPLSLGSNKSNVSCNKGANGAVSAIVSGGTLPYSYQWSNGEINPLINNLPAGSYSLTVTDNNGCTTLLSTMIAEPPLLSSNISTTAVACSGDATGKAVVTAGGGAPPYQYEWSNGMTSAMIDELKSGAYTLTITDSNQCPSIEMITINELPPLSSVIDLADVSCRGYSDGAAEVQLSGGTPPYAYKWSTGDNQSFIDNLRAGIYLLTVTDSKGCTQLETVDIIEAHLFTIGLGPDKELNLGDILELGVASDINSSEVKQYTWISQSDTLRCKDCAEYSTTPLKSSCLTVFVESIYGCSETASICYNVKKLRRVYVPNAFKPDSDDENQRITLFADQSVVNVKKLMFFDRWGSLLYSAENILPNSDVAGWDGTYRGSKMANDVYVWVAEVEYIDGQTEVLQGDVTLIR